nr:probable carbohydrate esterase At4g34215 [Tanacetum cinerariifolium]
MAPIVSKVVFEAAVVKVEVAQVECADRRFYELQKAELCLGLLCFEWCGKIPLDGFTMRKSDTLIREDVELYKKRSKRFFDRIRSDIGLPTLLIVQGLS